MMTVAGHELRKADVARPPARRRWLLGTVFLLLMMLALFQAAIVFSDDGPPPILRMDGRHLVASGTLAHRLHEQVADAGRTGPAVGPRVRDAGGAECRRFAGRPAVDGPVAGVACLIEGDWRITEVRQQEPPPRL